MQAQASGSPLEAITQNKPAMIGIFSVAGIAVIIGIVSAVRSMGGSAPPPPNVPGAMPGGGLTGTPGAGGTDLTGSTDSTLTGTAGPPGAAPAAPASPDGGMTGFPGQPPAAQPAQAARPPSAGVPVRRNPFLPSGEIDEVIRSIPDTERPVFLADAHPLYQELYKPKETVAVSDDENEGPPVPPMRVTAVVLGSQVSALMQIGGEFFSVVPGQSIPSRDNPIYRVEQIEAGKVVLTRRWEEGSRKGVQRIEVPISQAAGGGGAQRGGPRFGSPSGLGSPAGIGASGGL